MVYKILLIHLLRLLYSSLAVANVQGARHAPHHQYQGARTCRGDVQRSSAAQRSWLQTYRIVPRRRLHSCDRKKNCNNFLPPVFLENEHTVHRLCYEERIYIYLPIFPINTKGKRGIKVTRRRRIFFFSPSKNRLKNPRKTKLLFSSYFP